MRKRLVFITVFIFYAAQCAPVSAQGSPAQPPVGRYQGQKIDEAKLPGDQKSLLKQEVSKTAAFRSSFNSPS